MSNTAEGVAVPHLCKTCNGEGCEYCAGDGQVDIQTVGERVSPSTAERPDPKWQRGFCPDCGEVLVSNMYYIGGKGFLLVWECWASLSKTPTCAYRRVL
jgi:hypothetical protein